MTNLLGAFYSEPWAITQDKLLEIEAVLLRHANEVKFTEEQIDKAIAESSHTPDVFAGLEAFSPSEGGMFYRSGPVAYVPLHGTIVSRAGFMAQMSGATSPQTFAARVRAAASDEDIETIVLDIDSPGGTVSGTMTAADAVAEATESTRVVAVSENMMASAAYWIGSAADEIVVGENARIGSIGVIMAHRDYTGKLQDEGIKTTIVRMQEDKALGHPEEKLSDDAMLQMQATIQEHYEVFSKAVATHRSMPEDEVNDIGSRAFIAHDAVELGLADRIGTLSRTLDSIIADHQPESNPIMSTENETQDDVSAEVQALRDELAQAKEDRDEALRMAQEATEMIAEQRNDSLREKAATLVDTEIIGAGKALPSQRETLLSFCKVDGSFDQSAIERLRQQYAVMPKGSASPVGAVGVKHGDGRDTDENNFTVEGYDIMEDLKSNLPRQYREGATA